MKHVSEETAISPSAAEPRDVVDEMAQAGTIAPLIPHQWRPGESGNPSGRPKVRPILEEIRRQLAADPQKLRAIVKNLLDRAELSSDPDKAFKELRDMLDGKPATVISGPDDTPLTLSIETAKAKLIGDLATDPEPEEEKKQ